jgi:bacterioferritin (cytochrome b1)
MSKKEIIALLNSALELEHAAFVQYLSHAEIVDGINEEPVIHACSAPIINRLKEIASDEKNHQDKFRSIIGDLGGVPSMRIAATHQATTIKKILEQNLKDEKVAVDAYRKILERLKSEKGQGYYSYLIQHEVTQVVVDEQKHITVLEFLLGIQGSSY